MFILALKVGEPLHTTLEKISGLCDSFAVVSWQAWYGAPKI